MKHLQILALAALALFGLGHSAIGQTRLSDYIRPFVGTQGQGNTYPGPSAPFGMIQISPDTDITNWDTDSGYEYTDPTILGFSLTHLSGTGCPDLGDFLFMRRSRAFTWSMAGPRSVISILPRVTPARLTRVKSSGTGSR
jgi:putative alpha-1,2-mannosidase